MAGYQSALNVTTLNVGFRPLPANNPSSDCPNNRDHVRRRCSRSSAAAGWESALFLKCARRDPDRQTSPSTGRRTSADSRRSSCRAHSGSRSDLDEQVGQPDRAAPAVQTGVGETMTVLQEVVEVRADLAGRAKPSFRSPCCINRRVGRSRTNDASAAAGSCAAVFAVARNAGARDNIRIGSEPVAKPCGACAATPFGMNTGARPAASNRTTASLSHRIG